MKKTIAILLFINIISVSAQNPNCGTNQFYGVGGNNAIYSFTKSASNITYNGVYVNTIPGGSLAIADLGNGNHFYTNNYNFSTNTGTIQEYNGTNWVTVYAGPRNFQNAAGKGNYLYFHNIDTSISDNEIVRFDGTNLTTIWNDQTVIQPCADISVDNNGNVYFFTGSLYIANTLNIISPNGTMIAQIPINFEGFTGYGVCFLNDVFNIAFQGSNSQFPNKLVPITISGNTAILGSPITVPQPVIGTSSSGPILLSMSDLASCASANITLATSDFEMNENLNIYSNNNLLNIKSKFKGKAILFNSLGQKISAFDILEKNNEIDISNYPTGLYFINLNFEEKTIVKKFLKSN